MWLFLCTVLVFFMQAGFSMLELGLSRSKNAGNIIMKNLMDFCIGSLVFFFIGYGIMFGTSVFGLFGKSKFFLMGSDPSEMSFWMFQVVFAATASTIVSGGVAERTKFVGYLIYSVVITGFIYPVIGHWIWGGGWLSRLGFYDFAGSGVVHLVGGLAALAGAVMIGPRKGKYTRVGDKIVVKAILGHNLPLASLGVFILWFGWFGFNCGSTLDFASSSISRVMLTTTLAGAAGAIIAMVITWVVSKKPDPSMSLNGALAGLVAITAGADVISPVMAIVVGLIGGALVVGSVELIDKVLHIDDPVGAVSVHGVNGLWGVVAVGLFSSDPDKLGLFYGGGFATLGIQLLGVVVILGWTLSTAFLLFFILKKASCLRVTEKEEMLGLDISEHGCESYSGFQIFTNM
ncbi:MAG: ammonium transporter [Spirochaetales bacterium]|nr:ammonium transporter [Spirochaetales bacterium]